MSLVCYSLMILAAAGAETLVVGADEFKPAMAEWLEHRTAQGHHITWIEPGPNAGDVLAAIRRHAKADPLDAVLLLGDVPEKKKPDREIPPDEHGRSGPERTDAPDRPLRVPTCYLKAQVNVLWGSEPNLATDQPYADLDGDGAPDLAIGRLAADTPEELAVMVAKILAYERTHATLEWQRRINFVAGLGGFGRLADATLEAAARTLIGSGVPASYATSMTYANWRSPYCPGPRAIRETAIGRLNEGCLFWVYIGHGDVRVVDRMHSPEGTHDIFDHHDAAGLAARDGAPIALFLACYTGAYDAPFDCLAEEMLRAPGGPVAVVSGSRVTMPYGMSVMGRALLREYFVERRETLGEVLLGAKRRMMLEARHDKIDRALDVIAALLTPPGISLADERAETVALFNLLGDPLLQLHHPNTVGIDVAANTTAGARLVVSGRSPIDGQATIELVVQRDRLTFNPPPRDEYPPLETGGEGYRETYRRANDPRLATVETPVIDGAYRVEIDVPTTAWGNCHIRVCVEGADDLALGAADLMVRRPESSTSASSR